MKFVMKLDLHDEKNKRKAMQVVTGVSGVESVEIDMKENKLTVKGDVDPVKVATKLRKICYAEILTVGEDKKEAEKKEEVKKKDPVTGLRDQFEYMHHQYLYNYAPPPYYQPVVLDDSPTWWW